MQVDKKENVSMQATKFINGERVSNDNDFCILVVDESVCQLCRSAQEMLTEQSNTNGITDNE